MLHFARLPSTLEAGYKGNAAGDPKSLPLGVWPKNPPRVIILPHLSPFSGNDVPFLPNGSRSALARERGHRKRPTISILSAGIFFFSLSRKNVFPISYIIANKEGHTFSQRKRENGVCSRGSRSPGTYRVGEGGLYAIPLRATAALWGCSLLHRASSLSFHPRVAGAREGRADLCALSGLLRWRGKPHLAHLVPCPPYHVGIRHQPSTTITPTHELVREPGWLTRLPAGDGAPSPPVFSTPWNTPRPLSPPPNTSALCRPSPRVRVRERATPDTSPEPGALAARTSTPTQYKQAGSPRSNRTHHVDNPGCPLRHTGHLTKHKHPLQHRPPLTPTTRPHKGHPEI